MWRNHRGSPEDRGIPVQEVRSQVEHDRKFSQLLQESSASDGGVVRGSAADQEKTATTLDFRNVLLDSAKGHHLLLEVDSSTHRVDDRLGLLKDFLLHKGGVVALHDLLDLHLEGGDQYIRPLSAAERLRCLGFKSFSAPEFTEPLSISFHHLCATGDTFAVPVFQGLLAVLVSDIKTGGRLQIERLNISVTDRKSALKSLGSVEQVNRSR